MSMSAGNNTNTAMTTYSELKQSKQLLNLLQPEPCIGQVLRSLPLYDLIEYRNVCTLWHDLIEDICHFQKTLILRLNEHTFWNVFSKHPNDNWKMYFTRRLMYEPQNVQDIRAQRNSTLHLIALDAFIVNTLIDLFPRLQKLTIIVEKISNNRVKVFAHLVCLLKAFAPQLVSIQVMIIDTVPEQLFLRLIKVINFSMPKLKRLFIYYNRYINLPFEMSVLGQLEQFDFTGFLNFLTNHFKLWAPVLEKRCKPAVNTNSSSSFCSLLPLTLNMNSNIVDSSFFKPEVAACFNSLSCIFISTPQKLTRFCSTFSNLTILSVSIAHHVSYPFIIEQLVNLKKLIKLWLFFKLKNWEQFNIIGSELNPDQQLSTVLPTIKTLKLNWSGSAINHSIFSSWQLTTVFPNVTNLKMNFNTDNFACTACDWKIDPNAHPDRFHMVLNFTKYLKQPKCFYSEKQQEMNQLGKYEKIKLHIEPRKQRWEKNCPRYVTFSKTKINQHLSFEDLSFI